MKNLIVCAYFICPDGTKLRSSGGHFVSHTDKITKETYMLDATPYYVRSSGIPIDSIVMVTTDSPHEVVRENYEWTSFGVKGDEKPKRRPISQLDAEHIRQIIKTQKQLPKQFIKVFENELIYRGEKL